MFKDFLKFAMIGLLLVVVEILLVSSMIRQSWILDNIQEENRMNEHYFGSETAGHIRSRAKEVYVSLFVDTGIQDSTYHMLLPREDLDSSLDLSTVASPVFDHVRRSLGTFWATVYQVLTRLQVWIMWVPAALLLIIPAVVDGLMMRRVKVDAHITTSSIRMKYALLTIFVSLFVLLLSLFSPFAVNPVLYMVLSMLCIIMVSVLLANVQKDI